MRQDTLPEGREAPPGGCVQRAWRAHVGELRGYLRHRLADVAAADDVLQDVFVKALAQGREFCDLGNPRAWLFQVARNALVDRLRAAHPAEPLPDDLADESEPWSQRHAPIDALAECVDRVLGELSEDDADVLRACDLGGQTQREFAAARGLSLVAAKSRLLRARKRLRERLISSCQVAFDDDGTVCRHVPRSRPASFPAH